MADPVAVIQATLAPIFLVSGATIFLGFVQERLFRVLDRLRNTNTALRKAAEEGEKERLLLVQSRNLRRAAILRNAIFFGVLVIAFTVLTTLLILARGVFPSLVVGTTTIIVFALGLVSFAIALVYAVSDAVMSVRSMTQAAHELAETLD